MTIEELEEYIPTFGDFLACDGTFADLLGWLSTDMLNLTVILWLAKWLYNILIDMGNEVK